MKLVSIIIPCYNQAKYLPETLQSVLDQTYLHWECIIVNDGSLDDTEEVALEWCEKDNRFIYLKKENGGLSSARNAGLEMSKGDFVQFLDSDDLINKEKLKQSIIAINNNTELKLVVTDFRLFFSSYQEPMEAHFLLNQERLTFESILLGWGQDFTIPIHCGLFHKNTIAKIGFNESFNAVEDWLMWLNFMKVTDEALFLNSPLAYYRCNPAGMTKNYFLMQESFLKAYIYINNQLPEAYSKKFSEVIFQRLCLKLQIQQKKIIDMEYNNQHYFKFFLHLIKTSIKAKIDKIKS